MSDLSSDRDPVEALAEEFLERKRRGERPSMDEYVRKYPELAADIRDLFPALLAIEDLKPVEDSSEDSSGPHSRPAVEPAFEQLGDYRIIREVGRGGMGVVYEAEQMSLGRHVALKVLPRQFVSNPKIQQRFEREARAAARLHHTNIVPVYGVGEHEGTPYYAMQFIQGLGLDEVLAELKRLQLEAPNSRLPSGEMRITRRSEGLAEEVARSLVTGKFALPASEAGFEREANLTLEVAGPVAVTEATGQLAPDLQAKSSHTPRKSAAVSDSPSTSSISLPGKSGLNPHGQQRQATYWSSVAQIGWQTAQALQYAHDQGVLHRDIKPGNLMLDLRGTVWVTDFGLAKANDAQNLTEQGDILGTLRYMPPEVFQGQTDARGDVYSLGLTLYELLTFEPAFQENDRHKLIKQLTSNTPTKIAKLKPNVPRDLATIVTKAIERDPAHRYQTAKELADDLQRFLDDQPIQARRISQVERLCRWSRRNKGLAASLAVLAATLLVINIAGPIVTWRIARLNAALRDSQTRLSSTVDELTVTTEELTAARNRAANESARNLQLAQQSDAARVEAEAARQEAEAQRSVAFRTLYFAKSTMVSDALARPSGQNDIEQFRAEWRGKFIDHDPRSWEWSYLNSPSPYEHLTLQGHVVDCLTVAWSPDGKSIASGGWSDAIRLWDAATGRQTGSIPKSGSSMDLGWSPDGRRLAETVYPNAVKVWDATSGRLRFTLTLHSSGSHRAAWSPDGQLIATREQNGVIRLWEAHQGQLVRELEQSNPEDTSGAGIAWSPDGQQIAGAGPDCTKIWNIADGKLALTLGPQSVGRVRAIAWSPDGARIAVAGEQHMVQVWDVVSGAAPRSLQGHTSEINSVAWSPDSRLLASASADQTVHVWNIEAGQSETVLTGHKSGVNDVTWKPDGTQLASAGGGWNGEVKIWRLDRRPVTTIPCAEGWHGQVGVAWTPRGNRLAVAADYGKVDVWDLDTGEKSTVVEGAAFWPNRLCWNPDGAEVAVSINRQDATGQKTAAVTIYDVALAQERLTLPHGPGRITTMSWSADGKQLLTGLSLDNNEDALVRQWDTTTGQMVRSFPGMGSSWSPDGKRFAILRSYAVAIHDAASGKPLAEWSHPAKAHHEMSWSPDGKYLAVPFGSSVDIWETDTGRQVAALPGHNGWPLATWCPDGNRLVTGSSDGKLRIWDVGSASLALVLPGHQQAIADIAWSADGLRIASSGLDRTIRIWDATGGAQRDYVPTLLPTLDTRIAADPADSGALRTRAIIRARNGDWSGAAADFDQLSELLAESAPNCFTTGWWSLPSLPADVPDPFASSAAAADSPSQMQARPNWYFHADDPNGFVPLPANPPVLITRLYAATEGDVAVRNLRLPVVLRLNGERQPAEKTTHILTVRKGWNTLVVELDKREELLQTLTKPNSGLYTRISDQPADLVAGEWAEGHFEKAAAIAEEALRKRPQDVAALRLCFRAYDRYLYELDRRRTLSWESFFRGMFSPSKSKLEREAVTEAMYRARGRVVEILESLAVHDPDYRVSFELVLQCLDWKQADFLEAMTIGGVTLRRQPDGAVSISDDPAEPGLHTLISPQSVSKIRAFPAVGLIRLLNGQVQSAVDWLEPAAAERHGDQQEELLLLALAYERLQRSADARKVMQATLDKVDWPADDDSLVPYLMLVTISDALRSTPDDMELLRRRAAVFHKLGRLAKELSDLNALLKLKPDDPELIAAVGDLYCVTKDWKRAIETYSSLINEQTRDAELLAKRANAYEQAGLLEQANADWVRAGKLNPEDPQLHQRRLAILEATEQWAEIAAEYRQQLDRIPEGRRSYQPRNKLITQVIRRADPVFASLRTLRPDDSLMDVALGRDFVTRSDWTQAAAAYPQNIDKLPDPEEWYECAAALLLAGRPEEYRTLLKRMVERSAKTEDAFLAFAVARAAAIAPQELVPWPEVVWRAELAANQPNAEAWYCHVAGLAQYRAGDFDKALTWLQQSAATAWHPELNQIALCLVCFARGESDKARDYLEQVRQWLVTQQANKRNGYYNVQPTDWLELHLLLQEAEAHAARASH